MKKILSQFLILLSALLFALTAYQANQYIQLSATVGPSMAQINSLSAQGAEALGVTAEQLEQTRQMLTGSTNSLLQGILMDFVLAVLFLLGGYFSYPSHEHAGGL